MDIFSIKGNIYRLKKSQRNGKLIAYTNTGKVIIPDNQNSLHYGFAKVEEFQDKGNCYITKMKNVPWDFYYGFEDGEVIPYEEFCEVLEYFNFKHEYRMDIDEDNFFDVWANLNTGALVAIETWNYEGGKSYNRVEVYVPTGNGTAFEYHRSDGFSHGGKNVCCFNLCHSRMERPLSNVLVYGSNSRDWNGSTPNLWHYGDGDNINFAKVLTRIYDFKDDIGMLFNMKIDKALERYKANGYSV